MTAPRPAPKGRNLRSSLKRRARQNPMRAFDALPPELRQWLHAAALPWSPHSVRRIWHDALRRTGGAPDRALAVLAGIEARLLARDAQKIWGAGHPAGARDRHPQ